MDGLAFQETASDIEHDINTKCAITALHEYITRGGSQKDADYALSYLQARHSKLKGPCDEFRTCFFMDDIYQAEEVRARAVQAFRKIISRLNNIPLR